MIITQPIAGTILLIVFLSINGYYTLRFIIIVSYQQSLPTSRKYQIEKQR